MKLRLALTATALAIAIAAGSALAANAAAAPAVQLHAVEAAHLPVPVELHASCEYGVDTELETIAWAEIARLESLGFPVCDTIWSFGAINETGIWGKAYPQVSADDPRRLIVIELDAADYDGFDLTAAVRSTVRHEYGHILTYLSGDTAIDPAHELAADAVAELLTPAGETRVWFYDETVTADELAAAELVTRFTAQTL